MKKPTLCVIHEAVGTHNAIARVAMSCVCLAIKAGWRVTVVAKLLDKSLESQVEWLRLYVPPRSFIIKWVTARHFIRLALGKRKFDIIHSHQPQVADLADIFHCHFLTRVEWERSSFKEAQDLRSILIRLQLYGVLQLEDFIFRHWKPNTRIVFCSEMIHKEFCRLYGAPAKEDVLVNPCPSIHFASEVEIRQARSKLIGNDHKGPVIGYLGGITERKGYRRLLKALEGNNDVFLMMGGPSTEGFTAPSLKGHFKSLGWVSDLRTFYAACDGIVVPSYFDPSCLVVLEAVANGVPVIASEGVGTLRHLIDYGAGVTWKENESLIPLIKQVIQQKDNFKTGAKKMAEYFSEEHYGRNLLRIYEEVLRSKQR